MKTTRTKQPQRKAQPVLPVTTVGPSPGRRASKPAAVVLDNLEQINLHAAGVDVGAAENFVCVPARAVAAGQAPVRSFGFFSTQQDDLVEWLKECGVTSVAMEATGIYWMSLYDKLESAGLEVLLVDPCDVVADDVADVAAFVDGVRDDHTLVVAGQFQTEPGFGLFALLLRRHIGFPIHTAEEQSFSGAAFAGCDETVTKGRRAAAQSP